MSESGLLASPPAPGLQGVDWEVRVDFERLRQHRLARVRGALDRVGAGCGPALRDKQHPLRDEHPDRLLGVQQGRAVCADHSHGQATDLGLRFSGEGPSPPAPSSLRRRQLRRRKRRSARGDLAHGRAAPPRCRGVALGAAEDGVADGPSAWTLQKRRCSSPSPTPASRFGDARAGDDGHVRGSRARTRSSCSTQACAMVETALPRHLRVSSGGARADVVAMAHKRLIEMGSEFVEAINSDGR